MKPNGVALIKYKVPEGCANASKFASRDYLGRTIQLDRMDGKQRDVSDKEVKNKTDKKGKGKGKDGNGKGKNLKDKRDERIEKKSKGEGKDGNGKGKNLKDKRDE